MSVGPDRHPPEIVVAVDGSGPSRAALTWAVRQARSTGEDVCAVRAFDPAYLFAVPVGALQSVADVCRLQGEELHEEVVETLGTATATATAARVREEVLQGPLADAIARRARDATLLVMGSHGRGRVASTVLGSVSAACVHRARCPVVIIPSRAARSAPRTVGEIPACAP